MRVALLLALFACGDNIITPDAALDAPPDSTVIEADPTVPQSPPVPEPCDCPDPPDDDDDDHHGHGHGHHGHGHGHHDCGGHQ